MLLLHHELPLLNKIVWFVWLHASLVLSSIILSLVVLYLALSVRREQEGH